MNSRVDQDRSFAVLTSRPVRTRRKRRDWSDDEKARLISATLLPGAKVSAIARTAGLDPSQLHGWRRKALASGLVPALPTAGRDEIKFARVETSLNSSVEIIIRDCVVRVSCEINADQLTMILRAVREAC
nr:transposase [uncultured Cohaesibacter sp.]